MDAFERLSAALADRYRLERELGAGGMATVYLAQDLKHDRKVAVKVLKPELAAVLGAERFVVEIKTTASLQHPHILPLFDSGSADGFLFYVMPFIEGETLRDKLNREHQLGMDEALRITMEVADALDYAHRHGVIHRDIKPENILLHDGRPMVADFGIALAVSAAAGGRMTETGLSLGTPHYMSPEQATAEKEITGRSDVYSLASVLYEMLSGQPPHVGGTAQQIIMRIIADTPREVGELRRSVPAHVAAAIMQALEKLPADRFATAKEFAEALARVGPVGTRRVAPGQRGVTEQPWAQRLRQMARWAGPALVAVFCAWLLLQGARDQRAEQVLHLPIALEAPFRERLPWQYVVGIARDGKSIVYNGEGGVHVRLDLSTGAVSRVAKDLASILSFAFSPSSDSLVVRTRGWLGQLYVVALSTGMTRFITDSALSAPLSWGDDGWIYFPDVTNGISRIRPDGSGREQLIRGDTGVTGWMPGAIEALPRGRGLVFGRRPWMVVDPARSEIVSLDLRTKTIRQIVRGVQARYARSGHLVVAQSDGTLLAAPFDETELRAKGEFRRVLDSVEVSRAYDGSAAFTIATEGDLLYTKPGPVARDELVEVDRSGRVIAEHGDWGGLAIQFAVSADGRSHAAIVGRDRMPPNLWIKTRAGSAPVPLTSPPVLNYFPVFLNGGRLLAFVEPRNGRNWDLYAVPIDGSAEPTMLLDRVGDIRHPQFAKNDQSVVFCESNSRGQGDLFRYRFAPDTATTVLMATQFNECEFDVAPSERWLAYVSDESGRNEVYVRPLGGSGRQQQVSTEGATQPLWSHDGRELFYRNAAGNVVSVAVTVGETFAFGAPHVLFAAPDSLAWTRVNSANDRTFFVMRRNMRANGRVMLIRNWTSTLEQQLKQAP
jgi:serine/threonine-protein kinase